MKFYRQNPHDKLRLRKTTGGVKYLHILLEVTLARNFSSTFCNAFHLKTKVLLVHLSVAEVSVIPARFPCCEPGYAMQGTRRGNQWPPGFWRKDVQPKRNTNGTFEAGSVNRLAWALKQIATRKTLLHVAKTIALRLISK